VRELAAQPRLDRELPPVEAKAGKIVYACPTNIRVKGLSDSHAKIYSAELAMLFSAKWQMSVVALEAAIGQRMSYRMVPEVEVMLGDGRREKSSRLFFQEVRPHRGTAHPMRVLAPFLVATNGVSEVAPAGEAAQDLPLQRERFNVRPSLTMGDLGSELGKLSWSLAETTCSTGQSWSTAA
jgi:hypothetical protein